MIDIPADSPDSLFSQALKQKPTQDLSLLLIDLRDKYDVVLWLDTNKNAPLKTVYDENVTLLGLLRQALPNSRMATYENAREVLVSCPPDWTKIAVVVFEDRDVSPDTSEIVDRLVTLGARPYELPTLHLDAHQLIRRFVAFGL